MVFVPHVSVTKQPFTSGCLASPMSGISAESCLEQFENDLFENQTAILRWIIQIRNNNCPLHSFSENSRSINTLIDGFAGIGTLAVCNDELSSDNAMEGFDKVVSIENDEEDYQFLLSNVQDCYQISHIKAECVHMNFLDWFKANYSKLNYFKSVIHLDYAFSMSQSSKDSKQQLASILNEVLQGKCPMVTVRLPSHRKDLESLVKEKVSYRSIITNNELQEGYTLLALFPVITQNKYNEEKEYPSISSKRQFQHVWNSKVPEIRERFVHCLTKQMLKNCPIQQDIVLNEFSAFMENEVDDQKIYDFLFDLFHNKVFKSQEYLEKGDVNVTQLNVNSSVDVSKRINKRVNSISELIPEDFHVESMADIGCSEGSITSLLGKQLGLSKENVHGCDVRDIGKLYTKDFTFTLANEDDNTLPYASNSQSLVVALMSLHHIPNVEKTMEEIHRILAPGGLLIIREHDSFHNDMAVVLDILHGLYSLVWSNPRETPNFCDDYFCNYQSKEQWAEKFGEIGFKVLKEEYNRDIENNPYLYFYTCFQKQ
ncbi:hypothetical protein ABK040_002408 [Willaertia magna]